MAGRTTRRNPDDHTAACAIRFSRRYRQWLADPSAGAQDVVTTSTSPPTSTGAADDPIGTADWISRWQDFDRDQADELVEMTWVDRRLTGFGVVRLPQRAVTRGDASIARVAGESTRWARLLDRSSRILSIGPDQLALRQAAATTASQWERLSDDDMSRLLQVCRWAVDNPTVGLSAREVPVPGVDTKWIETRIRLIEQLVDAARKGHDDTDPATGLGLRARDQRLRIRILDAEIEFPLRDVESPADQLAQLWGDGPSPSRLVVVENLTTFLALPALPRTVAVFGQGFAVDAVAALPWALRADIVYWGDLDSHGFAILDRLRHHAPDARSVLMDRTTLDCWREFTVLDPSPTRIAPTRLTPDELTTLESLTTAGDLRLEQERIPWDWAIPRLRTALGLGVGQQPGFTSQRRSEDQDPVATSSQ